MLFQSQTNGCVHGEGIKIERHVVILTAMTIQTLSVASLKEVKNSVIGNPSAKNKIAQDVQFVALSVCIRFFTCIYARKPMTFRLVETLQSPQDDDIRIEAAHIISSLSYGQYTAPPHPQLTPGLIPPRLSPSPLSSSPRRSTPSHPLCHFPLSSH